MMPTTYLAKAESEFGIGQIKTYGDDSMGKDAFLQLLVAQLGNQDPLNPMEDKEFTTQLAQFSSLEELTNIRTGIEALATSSARQQMISAVEFIGKDVRAYGNSLSMNAEKTSAVYYELPYAISEGYMHIYDSENNLVRTEEIGARQAGEYEFNWDGKDHAGKALPEGVYNVAFAAEDVDGKSVLVNLEVSGEVAGVQTVGNTQYLRLTDGRQVDFLAVKEIVNPAANTPEEE